MYDTVLKLEQNCIVNTVFIFLHIGPCHPNPCHNRGTCEISETYRGDTFIGYICKCPPGFSGVHCQHSKLDLNNLETLKLSWNWTGNQGLSISCKRFSTTNNHLEQWTNVDQLTGSKWLLKGWVQQNDSGSGREKICWACFLLLSMHLINVKIRRFLLPVM